MSTNIYHLLSLFIVIHNATSQRVTLLSDPLITGSNVSHWDFQTGGTLTVDNINCPSYTSCYELRRGDELGKWISTKGYHSIQLSYSIRSANLGNSNNPNGVNDYCEIWYHYGSQSNQWSEWWWLHSTEANDAPITETINMTGADDQQYLGFDFTPWQIDGNDICWINNLQITGIPMPTSAPTLKSSTTIEPQSNVTSTNTQPDDNNTSSTSSTSSTSRPELPPYISSTSLTSTVAGDNPKRDTSMSVSSYINGIPDFYLAVIGGGIVAVCCCSIIVGILVCRKRMRVRKRTDLQTEGTVSFHGIGEKVASISNLRVRPELFAIDSGSKSTQEMDLKHAPQAFRLKMEDHVNMNSTNLARANSTKSVNTVVIQIDGNDTREPHMNVNVPPPPPPVIRNKHQQNNSFMKQKLNEGRANYFGKHIRNMGSYDNEDMYENGHHEEKDENDIYTRKYKHTDDTTMDQNVINDQTFRRYISYNRKGEGVAKIERL